MMGLLTVAEAARAFERMAKRLREELPTCEEIAKIMTYRLYGR